ncbi:microtubule-associated protein 1A-like [Oncorhynchus keta]|uniref:microtubule-associated protein 1A-like n=1 Tax=Oncorhynchus keta TaxID=8018 RepID=UPI00227BAD72|nr:microtubule-associated protein 1A-like [Oncorhynchus keta]
MAHHMGKEATPSPPLTRFTPVHILSPVPGRPHGHWGNRNHKPPETQAIEVIMEAVTSRGSPTFSSVDSNTRAYDSQSHLERLERQGERDEEEEEEEEERERDGEEEEEEREMLWEMQERDRDTQRERERNREMEIREKEEREIKMERQREEEGKREKERQREEEREREREREERQRNREEEPERAMEREWQAERERERERQGEEQVPGKGEGRQEEASYKGEQVDLSFSVRNRKGPASRDAAPTSRESRQGMPAACSYSERLLTTRLQQIQQLQQQQHGILHRAAHSSQPETARGGGPGPTKKYQPKYKPAIPQLGSSVPGCVSVNGSSSSMGSKLDEEDNEVKWFSDVAFRSLSSGFPQVDYLDMYNSSHRSSTGASQPSTQDSPAGANAALLAYVDLRGSAPRLDNEDFPVPRQQQQPSSGAYYPPHDDLDSSKKYEMGSFECVDVAVEREEPKKVMRGVPKRQIQLKRRNTAELKLGENSDGSPIMVPSPVMAPVAPVASIVLMDSTSLKRHNRETLQRQHSTPPALQEAYCPDPSPEPATERTEQTKRNGKLQKSLSLDETCTKTKMATCLINNILSKKMQNVGKQTDQEGEGGDLSPSEDKTPLPPDSEASTIKESTKPETRNLSSSINSLNSFSSEHLAVRRDTSPNIDVNRQHGSFGVKSSVRRMNHTINTDSTSLQRSNKRPEPTSTTPEMSTNAHVAPATFPRRSNERPEPTSTTPEMSPNAHVAPATFPRRSNERIESHSNRSPNHVSPWMRSEPPTTSCPQRNSDRTESPAKNPNSWRTDPVKPEMRSELVFPFESKKPTEKNANMGGKQTHDSKWRDERDDSKWRDERDYKQAGDSADAAARNTSVPTATRASSTQAGMTNTKLEYPSDSLNHKHPSVKSTYMSKTPEITLKPSPVTEIKKTSSLNISLLPEIETKPEGNHETGKTCQRETTEEDRTVETSHAETREEDRRIGTSHRETREEEKGVNTLNKMNEQTVNMDANRNSKAKAPLHKVRDVRRLVKNTYNLSFKAMPAPEKEERSEERGEEQRQERREARKEERKEERREEKKDDRVERKEGRYEEIIVRREEKKEEKLPPHPISPQKEEKLPPHPISPQKEEKLPPHPISPQKEEKLPPDPISPQKEKKLPPDPISLQKEEKLPPHPISLQKEEKLPPHPISLQKEEKLPSHPISLQKEEKLPPHPISLQKEEKLPPDTISLQKEEKLPPHPISLQKEEKLPPHPISLQEEEKPMQMEFKAISWRENKNKTTTTSNKTDRETSRGEPKPDSLQQVSKGPRNLSDVAPKSCATEEGAVTGTESNQHKTPVKDTVKIEPGNTKMKPSETESLRVTRRHRSISEASDKSEVVRRDTKPPMLGSSPKLPSKDRRVSCASLVLQDGSNKPKSFSALVPAWSPGPAPAFPAPVPACSPGPAPAFPALAPTLASSPSLGPKASSAPASPPAPASSPVLGTPSSTVPVKTPTPSHSVSILVKEKGYQADIGSLVSEAVSEAITRSGHEGGGGGGGIPGKHINQIEIPLQTRGPSDGGTSDSHRQRTYSSSSSSYVKAASSVSSSSTVKETSSFSLTSVNALTSASSFSSSPVNASSSSSHTHSAPNSPGLRGDSAQTEDSVRTPSNQERVSVRATVRDIEQRTTSSPPTSPKLPGSLPGSPALMRRYRPQVIEVRSLSKEIHKQDKQEKTVTSNTRPQTIEVHSIANGPPLALKPKFKPTDANSLSNETQQKPVEAATSTLKQNTEEERPVNNEKPSTSATTIHRHLSNDSTPASNYNKKLSVSAVSSYRPSPTKTTIIASFTHKPASTTVDAETSNERPKQPEASTQGQGEAPSYKQRPTTLTVSAPAPAPAPAPNQAPAARDPAQVPTHASAQVPTHAPAQVPTHAPAQVPTHASAQVPTHAPTQVPTHAPAQVPTHAPAQVPTHAPAQVPTNSPAIHSSQSAVVDITNHLQHPKTKTAYPQEQTMPVTLNNTNQPATVSTNTQAPVYTHHIHTQQPIHRSLSSDHSQRADDLRFYASDDPLVMTRERGSAPSTYLTCPRGS